MSKKSGLVVLVSLFAGGCAATFTSNRPKEVTLKDTYDPSAVRDAAAHVLFRAHLEVVAENDRSLSAAEAPCGYTIEYRDRGFVVRAAPLAPRADGLIDGRCLDTEDKLAKHIVKEVERPARLAVKEEKRRRRAERTAAFFGALGAVAQVAGTAASIASPAMGSSSAPSPAHTSSASSSSSRYSSSAQASSQVTWNGQQPVANERVFSASGQAMLCPHHAAEACMVSNQCGYCSVDPAGGRPVTITRAR